MGSWTSPGLFKSLLRTKKQSRGRKLWGFLNTLWSRPTSLVRKMRIWPPTFFSLRTLMIKMLWSEIVIGEGGEPDKLCNVNSFIECGLFLDENNINFKM